MGRRHPLVYEINTRQWLYALSARAQRRVTLADVPEGEFLEWAHFGFTHIWLMGVWKCGPVVQTEHGHWAKVLPDFQPADVVASPYAITAYTVDEPLGGPKGLQRFRERLHQHGLKLILDFVPNHTSSVHRWTRARPALYVRANAPRPETFRVGPQWIAHGKDPHFAAWIDTAQLDYRCPKTREVMTAELLSISDQCDGVRCDMSMLLLTEVFERTWVNFPVTHPPVQHEFWQEAIETVKQRSRSFLLLAEAYWDLEERLLLLGFDFVYDKRVYDHLVARDVRELRRHLESKPTRYLERATHFLENHDEERVAARLTPPEHRAAALLTLALPGMRLLHEGQLAGAQVRASVHLRRRAAEPVDSEVRGFYERLLGALRNTAVGIGKFELLRGTAAEVFGLRWQQRANEFDVAVINYSAGASPLEITPGAGAWTADDLLERGNPQTIFDNFQTTLEPFAAKLFRLTKQS